MSNWNEVVLPGVEDRDLIWRAGALLGAVGMLTVAAACFGALGFAAGDWVLGSSNLLCLPFAPLMVWLIRTEQGTAKAAHLLGFVSVFAIVGHMFFHEGPRATGATWAGVIVMVVTLGGGLRIGAFWCGALVLGLMLNYLAVSGGLVVVEELPLAESRLVHGGSAVLFAIFGFVVSAFWDRFRRQALHQNEEDDRRIRAAERVAMENDRLAAMGTLAAGVGHELNTPLAFVTLQVERLKTEQLTRAELTELAEETLDGVERMREIVQRISTFSRMGAASPVEVSMELAIEEAIRLLHAQAQGVDILVSVAPGLGAWINRNALGQVLLNVVRNALDAIQEGDGRTLRITADREQRKMVLRVIDDGIGMTEEQLRRAQEPFFTTKAMGRGTGLGLSICREIVDEAGGSLELRSTPGEGTTVRIELPAVEVSLTSATPVPAQLDLPERLRVLVIDDDVALGRVVKRVLSEHEICVVHDAGAALARLGERWDVLLCDLMMPEMAGWELYAQIALERPELAERTLFMSGGAYAEEGRQFAEAHRDRLLTKPFTSQELRDHLSTLFPVTQA